MGSESGRRNVAKDEGIGRRRITLSELQTAAVKTISEQQTQLDESFRTKIVAASDEDVAWDRMAMGSERDGIGKRDNGNCVTMKMRGGRIGLRIQIQKLNPLNKGVYLLLYHTS